MLEAGHGDHEDSCRHLRGEAIMDSVEYGGRDSIEVRVVVVKYGR